MKKIYNVSNMSVMVAKWSRKYQVLLFALFAFGGLFGVNEKAWGDDCRYTISNKPSSINTIKSGKKYKFNQNNEIGSINNQYGISKIYIKATMERIAFGSGCKIKFQYKNSSGNWVDLTGESELAGYSAAIPTSTAECNLSGSSITSAISGATAFRIVETQQETYSKNRTITLNDFYVVMAKTLSGSTSDMTFEDQTYGTTSSAKTRDFTFSNEATGKSISVSSSNESEFIASVSKSGDCTGTATVSVKFKPSAQGERSGSITVSGDCGSKTFTVKGKGLRPASSISMSNSNVNVSVAGINSSTLDLSDLISSRTGNGAITYTIVSATGTNATTSTASIDPDDKKTFSATACGVYTLQATQAESDQYESSTSNEFTVTVNKLTPTIVFDNKENQEIIYSKDVIEQPAARMYNGKEIDRNVISYVSSDPSITGAIYVNGTTLTARDVTATEGNAVNVTITASAFADDLYNAPANATHNYAVRAKRSTYFYLDNDIEATSKTLSIGEKVVITYNENVNGNLTVGTEGAFISYEHDAEHRKITVTALKGTLVGNGVQTITVNQPSNDYLWGRTKVYTFTVQKKSSALSLSPLTTAMGVEDTVTNIYSGLANTAEGLQFSCSPEGSMKYEGGKLIALQAGNNTVTFSQPATEYWTGVSQSKTITVNKKNPNVTTELGTRHAWYSIIEHPFSSLNKEKALTITSSSESLAKYVAAEDKIYVYGTSGDVTFTVNQDANYKYNAIVNYQKTFEIFQPNNRLEMNLTESNLSDYNGGGAGGVKWNGGGVLVGSPDWWDKSMDWDDKYVIIKFVGIPETLSFDFERTVSIATEIDWYFGQSADGTNWSTLKKSDAQIFGGVTSGSESFHLNPDTRYVKLCYSGNYGGRFKNVRITERKEIAPKAATTDFGLGYNGNDPTPRTIKVDWYNVKPCTVTITGKDADKFVLGEGYSTINSMLDNYGTAELIVSYKHETNSVTSHTATLHIEDEDGNFANVTLTGQTTPAPQDIIWRSDLTPMPIVGSFQNAAMVTTGQVVTLTSNYPEIVRVVDNTTLEPVSAGIARVTATAAGNNKWAETTSYLDIEVTNKNVQFITWNDNLSNRKREDGQTVNITLTATSTVGLPITYELDEAAQDFASINGNVLSLTGWGKGQVIAKQAGNEDYVAVQAVKSLVSRNPSAGCKPLVGEYTAEYTLHTIAEKEIELNGEAGTLEFDAKCDGSALYGLWVGEYYDGYWHEITQIMRLEGNNITSSYKHFGPYNLTRRATAVKLYTETGATMTRMFKNLEVTLAKYLELEDNHMDFSQVDKGSNKTQSFYINYSNLTGMLDVEMETASTQFEVLTETVGEDCGDAGQNKQIQIRFTGKTLGTEENAIIVHNYDQSLRIPVSATVVLPSQTITWEPEVNVKTTDNVVLSATATSELPVSFTSGNAEIAEVKCEGGVYSLDIKKYGDVAITAHQPGDEVNWGAATDKTITFHISRVVPVVNTWPTAQVILPNTLSGATLIGGVKPEGIEGSFQWEDESLTVTRQAHTFNVQFVPTNLNYYEPVSHSLEIEILKTPQTINWAREDVSEEGCSDVIILDATASSGLPITYHSSDSTKAYAIDAVVNDVTVKKLYILKGGEVTITAEQKGDETYAAVSVSKIITLIRVQPTIETLPTATDMYVHHFLSNSTPQGGLVKAGENTVNGVFNWASGEELMDEPGINQRTVIFHPYNSDFYQEISATIDVNVQRFAPTVIHDFTTETRVYGTKLNEFILNGNGQAYDYTDPAHYSIEGTFAWKDADYIPSVSETKAILVFHPTHTEWYDDVEVEVPIQLNKAILLGATATATMFYGQVLGDAELTNTTQGIVNGTTGVVAGIVTWDPSLNLKEYYIEGTHPGLPIRFTPSDPNYEPVEIAGTAVLTVNAGYVFDGNNGASTTWGVNENWQGHEAPNPLNNEKVVILADVDIDSDVSVDAITIKEGVTVTVKNGATLTIGASDSYLREQYGNLHVENGGKVNLGEGKVNVNNFILDAKLGNTSNAAASGQVSGAEQLNVNGDVYFQLALDPSGECSQGWYDFTVPFPVDVMTGITRLDNTTHSEKTIKNEVNYAIMDFSENRHVESGYGWKKFRGVMQPGKCYSITIDDVDNVYRFKKTKTGEFNNQNGETLAYTDSELSRRGWNGLGNGTLKHIDLGSETIEEVQIYNHSSNSYTAVDIDEFTYVVGSAYFVQAPVANTVISYNAGTKVNDYLRAPRRVAARENSAYKLTLTREGANVAADRLYVGASEEASDSYEIARDLAKFGTPTDSKAAQIWANAYGMKLCDIDMPMTDNAAECTVGLFAPQAGSYELKIERAPEDANLYLTYNGEVIWDLTASPYLFDLAKGTTEGYGLRIEAQAPQIPTGVEETESTGQTMRKVIIDNKVYVITPEGKIYDIIGKGVKF